MAIAPHSVLPGQKNIKVKKKKSSNIYIEVITRRGLFDDEGIQYLFSSLNRRFTGDVRETGKKRNRIGFAVRA